MWKETILISNRIINHWLTKIIQWHILNFWFAEKEGIAESFGIPYHVFPVTKDTKTAVEAQELDLMKQHNIDLVILARYMQIITDDFCVAYPVINIHHSFLPAFIGGKPYHRAHERGVKVCFVCVCVCIDINIIIKTLS